MLNTHPIGVFDSGYGGLTVLKELTAKLPDYDFIYMGDNARAPYGTRSFDTVYRYTLEAVKWFFNKGCPLVLLACNTASAKALRTIQQKDLPGIDPQKRVLGVIRPTTERIGHFTKTGNVGIFATAGTVQSGSYPVEVHKFFPEIKLVQQACPLWVPLIENKEHESAGTDFFVKKYTDALISQNKDIDTVLLACTHYPLLMDKIRKCLPAGVSVIAQGEIVANSLVDYLQRHPEMDARCGKNAKIDFFTTDSTADFDDKATIFYGKPIKSMHAEL